MLLDVNSPLPNESLNPNDLTGSYDLNYLRRIFAVVEAFHNFPNTLGFFGGNEVMDDISKGEKVPPYLRAVTRDLKSYISKHSPRDIPVGYSAADVRDILADSWSYLQCAVDGSRTDSSRIDFFGLNSYSWCGGDANFETSGYNILVSQFSNTTIPVFFSEYGCNKVEPRVFNEVQTLYGPLMTPVMSGGIIYEYVQEEANKFGLVALYDNGTAQILGDYDNLQAQFNKLDIKALDSGNSSATKLIAPTCKSSLIGSSSFNRRFSLPAIPSGGQALIDNGLQNPNNGKLVAVTETNVPLPVYGSHGGRLKNLVIKPLLDDETNTPNGSDTSGPASTTSPSANATPTHKGDASRTELKFDGFYMACFIIILIMMFNS